MASSRGLDILASGVGGLYERRGEISSFIKWWEFLRNGATVSFSDRTHFCRAQRHVLLNTAFKFSFSYETKTTVQLLKKYSTLGT